MSVASGDSGGADAMRVPHPLVVKGVVDDTEAFCGLTESTLRRLAAEGHGSVDLLVRFRSHYDRRMIMSISDLLAMSEASSSAPESVVNVDDVVTTVAEAYFAVRDVFFAPDVS